MGDEGKTVNLMNYIQDSLRSMDLTKPLLSTLAQKGEDEVLKSREPRFTSTPVFLLFQHYNQAFPR